MDHAPPFVLVEGYAKNIHYCQSMKIVVPDKNRLLVNVNATYQKKIASSNNML